MGFTEVSGHRQDPAGRFVDVSAKAVRFERCLGFGEVGDAVDALDDPHDVRSVHHLASVEGFGHPRLLGKELDADYHFIRDSFCPEAIVGHIGSCVIDPILYEVVTPSDGLQRSLGGQGSTYSGHLSQEGDEIRGVF